MNVEMDTFFAPLQSSDAEEQIIVPRPWLDLGEEPTEKFRSRS